MHVVFYSLPEYPLFYPEIVNNLGIGLPTSAASSELSSANISCISIFSSFEKMSLERIVGEKRANHMTESKKALFMFC